MRPSAWWFVVAGVVAAVGVAVAAVIFVRGIVDYVDRVEGFDRARLPANLEVEITEPGGYSIYHEYDDDDGAYADEPDVSVTDPSGDSVPLDRYAGSVSYSAGGHEGEGIYTFDADETGTYAVMATGDMDHGIAVGRGVGRGLVGAVVGSLLVGLVAVVAGTVVAIVVGVTRGRHRRALMPPPAVRGWGPVPPPGWGAPAGPSDPGSGWGAPARPSGPGSGWGWPAGPGTPSGPGSAAPGGYGWTGGGRVPGDGGERPAPARPGPADAPPPPPAG